MAGEDDKEKATGIPEWQKHEAELKSDPSPSQESNVDVARRFLQQDDVKHSSREKKIEFLKTKGLTDEDIVSLLDEEVHQSQAKVTNANQDHTASSASVEQSIQKQDTQDHPPIITYPEFLAKPARPPPLVTPDGVLAALYSLAGLSTLLYGTQKYVVSPMVDTLSDARHALFDTTLSNLGRLVERLEHSVSEMPASLSATHKTADADDDFSDVDDPSELFHRDIGTQTSESASLQQANDALATSAAATDKSPLEQQLSRLTTLVERLQYVSREHVSQAEDLADVRTVAGVVQDDITELAAAGTVVAAEWSSSWSTARKEPDDEIRRVKEGIRRLKGALLSTRSFPARQGA